MPKITTFLWYDAQAEEAARFYTSVFKDSKINAVTRYTDAGPGQKGSVMTVSFELDGNDFVALNGGPTFKFNEAISLQIDCENQDEVDYYWEKLSAGGEKSDCGWVKDRYGLSWQVTPRALMEMLSDRDQEKVDRVMAAMLTMKKLNVAELERAYDGR